MKTVVRPPGIAAVVVLVLLAGVTMGMGMGRRQGGGPGGMMGQGGMGGPGGMMGRGGMGGPGGMMGAPPSIGENPLPASEEVLARGQELYGSNCAACHGAQGRGDGPAAAALNPRPPDLRGTASTWSDGQIAAQIQNGRGTMPPFRAALDETGVWSVVHFVRRLQGR